MQPSVLFPAASDLVEIRVIREPGPPASTFDSDERRDRVRAAIANTGFAYPMGTLTSIVPDQARDRPAADLAVALAILLADPAHAHLQREGWIAWGALTLFGSTFATDDEVVNDLGPHPFVGRIWEPSDRIPSPHEDAVLSIVQVSDLGQAWDVITFFAGAESTILEGVVHGPGT